jgi:nucleoside-diphosphate-sugar epimerase
MALAANGPGLAVVALRPRLIYGPAEPHMLPRLLATHRAGRLRVVGDGTNRVGLTFLDNAAAAHLQAADALGPGAPHAGRAYFITDAEPVVLWRWVNDFFAGVGLPPLTRRVPLWLGPRGRRGGGGGVGGAAYEGRPADDPVRRPQPGDAVLV